MAGLKACMKTFLKTGLRHADSIGCGCAAAIDATYDTRASFRAAARALHAPWSARRSGWDSLKAAQESQVLPDSTTSEGANVMAVNVQVIFYSTYGHVFRLAEAVAEGAREISGAGVQVLQVPETLSDEILTKMGAVEAKKAFAHIPVADPKKPSQADAILLGTPTRYGSATAQMRAFLDATGSLWNSGALIGKVGGAFTSTASQHGGQETTLLTISTFFYHQGMVIVGVPYSSKELLELDEVSGGTPYGASTIAGSRGERQPTENELAIARAQGRFATQIASKLKGA
jgi:NAD(P)H dehydrogenase (quinone)